MYAGDDGGDEQSAERRGSRLSPRARAGQLRAHAEEDLNGIRVRRTLAGGPATQGDGTTASSCGCCSEPLQAAGEVALPPYPDATEPALRPDGDGIYRSTTRRGTRLRGAAVEMSVAATTAERAVIRKADVPIQPYFVYDSRLSGTSQHGVFVEGGSVRGGGWLEGGDRAVAEQRELRPGRVPFPRASIIDPVTKQVGTGKDRSLDQPATRSSTAWW